MKMLEVGIVATSLTIAGLAPALSQDLAKLPAAFAVPSGTVVASMTGSGAQLYRCGPNASGALLWTFREPIAALIDAGKTIGRHFAGPTWKFTDLTSVVGKVAARADGGSPADIPWLKLTVTEPTKNGPVAGATTILRIDTKGGMFAGSCSTDGALHAEPYEATYMFVK